MSDLAFPDEPTEETPGWVAVGVVLDGDPIDVDGINPWTVSWHATGETVGMRHPAWPTQLHGIPVYTTEHEGRTITFAAGELSNTVWGFYRPAR